MEFCQKCGGIIIFKDKGRVACANCGLKPKKKPKVQTSEKIKAPTEVAIIKEDAEESTYPIIDMKCQKCKNKKTYFWTLQTRAGDESETKFYKCTKCKHSWRVYI